MTAEYQSILISSNNNTNNNVNDSNNNNSNNSNNNTSSNSYYYSVNKKAKFGVVSDSTLTDVQPSNVITNDYYCLCGRCSHYCSRQQLPHLHCQHNQQEHQQILELQQLNKNIPNTDKKYINQDIDKIYKEIKYKEPLKLKFNNSSDQLDTTCYEQQQLLLQQNIPKIYTATVFNNKHNNDNKNNNTNNNNDENNNNNNNIKNNKNNKNKNNKPKSYNHNYEPSSAPSSSSSSSSPSLTHGSRYVVEQLKKNTIINNMNHKNWVFNIENNNNDDNNKNNENNNNNKNNNGDINNGTIIRCGTNTLELDCSNLYAFAHNNKINKNKNNNVNNNINNEVNVNNNKNSNCSCEDRKFNEPDLTMFN